MLNAQLIGSDSDATRAIGHSCGHVRLHVYSCVRWPHRANKIEHASFQGRFRTAVLYMLFEPSPTFHRKWMVFQMSTLCK